MVTIRRIAVVIIVLYPKMLIGQENPTTTRSPFAPSGLTNRINQTSFLFDKSLNTYHWTGLLNYAKTFDGFMFDLNERFSSTLIRIDRNLIRDEQQLRFAAKQQLNPNMNASGKVTSFILSDDQRVGIDNASSHAFYGGIEYLPSEHFSIEPMIGLRLDNQLSQHDQGASYLLALSGNDLVYEGYRMRLGGHLQHDQISPRTLETHADSVIIRKIFFGGTQNALQISFNRNRRDFYFAADSIIRQQFGVSQNIETRADNTLNITDTLDYDAGRTLHLSFQGNIITRTVNRGTRYKNFLDTRRTPLNTTIDEFRIDGSVQARYSSEHLRSTSTFFYQERDEKHLVESDNAISDTIARPFLQQEERKNNHARRTALNTDIMFIPSSSDTITLSGSTSVLRYDTPSLQNDDDRDELTHSVRLMTLHQFNRYLNVSVIAEVYLLHLVYLSATNSANNSWNRILRLSPRSVYTPSHFFSTTNTFEVLANYTAYDFEYTSSSARSFAFRQFGFIDSTTIALTKHATVQWYSDIRNYERGELRWSDFSERPLNYFEDRTYIGMLTYQPSDRLLFSAGIRYFSQTRYTYNGSDRSVERILRSIGPISSIIWDVGQRTRLYFNGWYERQTLNDQPSQNFTTMTMMFSVNL